MRALVWDRKRSVNGPHYSITSRPSITAPDKLLIHSSMWEAQSPHVTSTHTRARTHTHTHTNTTRKTRGQVFPQIYVMYCRLPRPRATEPSRDTPTTINLLRRLIDAPPTAPPRERGRPRLLVRSVLRPPAGQRCQQIMMISGHLQP